MATFRTWDRQHYLRVYNPAIARPDGRQGQLFADSTGVGPDEIFEVVPAGSDTFGLKIHGVFVSMQPDGRVEVNRPKLQSWERFRLVPGVDGGQGIRSVAWGYLLAAEQGGGGAVTTRTYDAAEPWESFFPVGVGLGGNAWAGGLHGAIRRIGPRALGDDRGPQLYASLSRFYHGSEIRTNPDRVKRDVANDVAVGYDAARVLFQVGSLDSRDYWAGHVADQNAPGYENDVRRLLDTYRAGGLRLSSACLIGKGNGTDRQSVRRAHVQRLASIMKDYPDVILVAQMMNEPTILGYASEGELLELEALFRQIAPRIVTSTGAYPDNGYGESVDTWGQVGTPHLPRDTDKSEMQDRPWRQPWEIAMLGKAWVNDEPIGPGASVNSERRAKVLRSHAAVSYISGAASYVFHADEGIRGLGDLPQVPGYLYSPKAKRFLPGGLANGTLQNSNSNFPNRHWDLDPMYYRAGNGNTRGIVRCFGMQLDGRQYTIPFGPVSDFELIARRGMRVECYQQDLGEQLWTKGVSPGERVRFSGEHPDYLLISTVL
jgi:hypothetical protein